jgi:hypothetical protein
LQQTRARQKFSLKLVARHQPMQEQSGQNVEETDDDCAEDHLDGHACDAEQIVQVAVLVEHDGVVIPSLTGPEPDPTRPAYERADHDQDDPSEPADAEHAERKLALADRVIAVPQRV